MLSGLLVFLILSAAPSHLLAQDIMVGEQICLFPVPPPDEPARASRQPQPDYPADLRKTDETGYAFVMRFTNAKGRGLFRQVYATHTLFQRAVEDALADWKPAPARHNGVAVDSLLWLPIIFNPKSAGTKSAEAGPRLLAVAPVITTERPTPKDQPPVVRIKLSLDAGGAIIQAEPEDPGVNAPTLAAIRESLPAWRFAPARQAGVAVAAEISLPVYCQLPPKTDLSTKQIPPKTLKQVEPKYPRAMSRFGLRGSVTVDFVIDTTGAVQNPTIVRTDNPAFDEPAIEAILQWKFQPATSEGKPIKTKTRQDIHFEPGGSQVKDAFTIEGEVDQSKLPAELRYDTGARIRHVQLPVYPVELLRKEITGNAQVTMLIDPQGQVAQVKVIKADHPEFGLALVAASEGFRFDPALKNGRPVPHLLRFEQDFNDRQMPEPKADRLLALEKKHPEKIVPAAELDSPLKPASRQPPIFPVTVPDGVTQGRAMIEFLVDTDGRARLPRIVETTEPAFGYAAVQAVAAWWFEPPLKNGKPVVVRARIPVDFVPPKPKQPAGQK